MYRPILLFALLCAAIGLAAPATAAAQDRCTEEDPTGCETYTRERHAALTVSAPVSPATLDPPKPGKITSSPAGIDCGATCTHTFSWTEFCINLPGQDECEGTPPTVTLTASAGPDGYQAAWSGCESMVVNECTLVIGDPEHEGISLTWVDTQAPTVNWSGQPSKVGPDTKLVPTWSDNSNQIVKMIYKVGTSQVEADAAPFAFDPATSLADHGRQFEVTAVARDAAGKESPATPHTYTVDSLTGLTSMSTPPSHTRDAPPIAFDRPADVSSGDVTCRTVKDGSTVSTTTSCASPYTPVTTVDDHYVVVIEVRDDVGNIAKPSVEFTLDRGAPNLAIGWPAADALVGGPFTPLYSVSDGLTPLHQIVVTCALDGGAFGACTSLAPPDGRHTLAVSGRDLAGNERRELTALTYDGTAPAVRFTAGPSEGEVIYARSTAFGFAIDDVTAVVSTCRLDDGPIGPCTSSASHELNALSAGVHTFALRVVDAAGHVTQQTRRFAVGERLPQVLDVGVRHSWWLWHKRTSVRRLSLRRLQAGAQIELRCAGKGCPFRVKRFTASKPTLDLKRSFKGRKLHPGARIDLRVTKDAMVGKLFRYVMRARKEPKGVVRCLPPQQPSKPTACA